MKKLTKLLLIITLIAAILAMNVSAYTEIVSTNNKKTDNGTWSAKTMDDENGQTYAIKSPSGNNPSNALIVSITLKTPLDISKYEDDGYLSFLLYVNNPDAFSANGSIELTSAGRCDAEELSWAAPAGDVVQGWNEIILPFADGNDGGLNFEALNFFRFFWFPADGADLEEYGDPYFAIADLRIGHYGDDIAYPNNKIQWDNLTYFDMTNFNGAATNLAGQTSVSMNSDSLVISQTNALATPIDLSKYEDGGYMHMWMYIDGVENFTETEGQFELTSGGACDVDELTFSVQAADLHDGWNEIIWCFDDAAQANADMSAINFVRFYKHVSAPTTVIIRDLSFGTEEEMDMVPETEPPATEPPATEAPATDAPAAEAETTGEAPAETPTDAGSSNTTVIIIAVVAVVVIAVAVVAVIASKKKKK
ncbi:MAG: hypothetical protein IJA85_00450 [Clostridia bacterium]|nr:hypothetical protein [Clostridia bacterium]